MIGLGSDSDPWIIVAMRLLFPGLFLLAVQLLVGVVTSKPLPGVLAAIGVALVALTVSPFAVSGRIQSIIYIVVTVLVGLLLTGSLSPGGLLKTISGRRRSRVLNGAIVAALGALLLGWAVLVSEMLR